MGYTAMYDTRGASHFCYQLLLRVKLLEVLLKVNAPSEFSWSWAKTCFLCSGEGSISQQLKFSPSERKLALHTCWKLQSPAIDLTMITFFGATQKRSCRKKIPRLLLKKKNTQMHRVFLQGQSLYFPLFTWLHIIYCPISFILTYNSNSLCILPCFSSWQNNYIEITHILKYVFYKCWIFNTLFCISFLY